MHYKVNCQLNLAVSCTSHLGADFFLSLSFCKLIQDKIICRFFPHALHLLSECCFGVYVPVSTQTVYDDNILLVLAIGCTCININTTFKTTSQCTMLQCFRVGRYLIRYLISLIKHKIMVFWKCSGNVVQYEKHYVYRKTPLNMETQVACQCVCVLVWILSFGI